MADELPLTLILSSGLVGALVAVSYLVVLFDNAGLFPLPSAAGTSFFSSPYWLGMPSDTVTVLVLLQMLAAIGALLWFIWLVTTPEKQFENTILSTETNRIFILQLFLWSSTAWPFTAYLYLNEKSTTNAVLACTPLWLAAVAVALMIGATFESNAPPVALLAALFLGLVVVLCDGVGWAFLCFRNSV